MNPADYYRSISRELGALRDRVRYLIQSTHWPTDGEWKESVLRSILRRHLPQTVGVGRGFIVGENSNSTQIDVLLYDATRPVLHQEGDLVFLTPDVVRGVIEVKSTVRLPLLRAALTTLGNIGQLAEGSRNSPFLGLFAFESDLAAAPAASVLRALQAGAQGNSSRVVSHVCVGPDSFFRYWTTHPVTNNEVSAWHAYHLPELAAGYFLANAIEAVVGDSVRENLWAWFPAEGKEIHKSGEIALAMPMPTPPRKRRKAATRPA